MNAKAAIRNAPEPPKTLSLSAKKLWKSIIENYELEPHHLKLLQGALEQLTRAEAARDQIAKEGLTVLNRFDEVREHPAVGIERQSQLAFLRLVRELGLDIEAVDAARGPLRKGY